MASNDLFYRRELIPIIEHAALELMTEPIINGKKMDGSYMTLTEISYQNSMNSMYNSGIRTMAKVLIEELRKSDDDE